MAAGDPTEKAVTANTWTLAASNVTAGQISILAPTNDDWYWTQRATGGGAPTTELPEVKMQFQNLIIDSSVALDIYVYCKGAAGRVRVV